MFPETLAFWKIKPPPLPIRYGHDGDTTTNSSTEPAPHKHPWLHWHEPGTSKADKKLILKLDFFLLSFSCLYFFIKQLDQNNISNAYVSGMQEELKFGPGNELSWMNIYFNIGVIIGGPISNLTLTKIRPRYWLPGCLLAWSLFVLGFSKSTKASEFYALRLCVGLFESAAWPGFQYVLGCWYKKSEIARSSGLFVMSGVLGQMFRVICSLRSIVAWREKRFRLRFTVYFFFYPDTPRNTRAFYLSEIERERARTRIEEDGRTPIGKFDLSVISRVLRSWQFYAFTLAYAFWTLTAGSYVMQYFQIWPKSLGTHSVPQTNNIPTGLGAVNFIFMVSTGIIIDRIGKFSPVCFAVGCLSTFCFTILTAWPASQSLKMAAFLLSGCYGCYTPILAGWVNSTCGDQQLRALTLAFMVSFGQAPKFSHTHGWASALCFAIALTLWTGFGIDFLSRVCGKGKETARPGPDEVDPGSSA